MNKTMDVRGKLVELFRNAFAAYGDGITGCTREEFFADFLAGYGVTVQAKKEKPPVNLTGKCGSCAYAEKAIGHFGNSQCYVECTNKERLSCRMYQERPLAAVRQRTAKACKKYLPQPPKGE